MEIVKALTCCILKFIDFHFVYPQFKNKTCDEFE